MTKKQKVRQVILTTTVTRNGFLHWDSRNVRFPNLEEGTKVELAIYEDSPEPTRKLVKPEGAVWKMSRLADAHCHLINDDGIIAEVKKLSSQWLWTIPNKHGYVETHELAQQAAEEAKADAREDGFGWKEEGPEYVRWRVDWMEETEGKNQERSQGYYGFHKKYACIDFEHWKHCGRKCTLSGMDNDLNWHELDRFEAKEEKD